MHLCNLFRFFTYAYSMKTIILVLCLVVTNAFCQILPPLNRTIIQEADNLIDKKVGKGLCGEFVLEVLSRSKVPIIVPKKPSKVYVDDHWTELPKNATIYPGDIIVYDKHIAIIYAKLSSTEYTVIDQNFSGRRKYSYVGFGTIEFLNKNGSLYAGSPTIYRITL